MSIVVLAALLAATAIASEETWEAERARAEEEQLAVAREAAALASSTIAFSAGGLEGAQGLLNPGGALRVRGFRLFAERVSRQRGFSAIAWHPLIFAVDRPAYEDEAGPITVPRADAGVKPAPEARQHLPVRYIEGDVRPRTVEGLDALAVPELARAAHDAGDRGEPRIGAPIELAGAPRALVMFQPLYLPGRPIRTVGGRRRALRGEISGAIPTEMVAEALAQRLPDGVALAIEDTRGPVVLPVGGAADQASAPVDVAGRRWQVSVGGVVEPSPLPAGAVGVGGLALSALVGLLLGLAERREANLERSRAAAERAAARESLLVSVGDSLERTVSLEGRLDELARAVVPGLADLCAVDLELDERGLRRVGVAAADPRREEVLRLLPARRGGRQALSSGEVRLLRKVDDEVLAAMAGDETELARLRSLEIESMIVAPLWARARILGFLTLCTVAGSARPPYREEDAAVAGEIADRAALALDNARLYEEQLEIAQTLQRSLLPRRLPQPAGLEVVARYRAGREGIEVGGDFYDFFGSGEGWAAVVGDVCGKGSEAAALTGLVRHTLRAGADTEMPAEALTRVDRAINDETGGAMFCTLAHARIETRDSGPALVTAAIAGHPEPLIVRRSGQVERVATTGPLLGAFGDASFGEVSFELAPGETLVLVTDGVIEARARGQLFGEQRLEALLGAAAGLPLEAMLAGLEEAVVRFAGGQPQDDLALLAVRLSTAAKGGVAADPAIRGAGRWREPGP